MPNCILEGESYFVLRELERMTENKKVEINPEVISNTFSMFNQTDYYVIFDPNKDQIDSIQGDHFILCFMDKNVDQRLDYVKKIKQTGAIKSFDPIPTTNFPELLEYFPDLNGMKNNLPSKKAQMKYKGAKQNYEWFDLCLIDDLYYLGDVDVFNHSYFDIWKFSDDLWSGNTNCLNQIQFIDDKNFEDYFNRIRETSKDYLEVIQTGALNFYQHKSKLPTSGLVNEFRFSKIKEKLSLTTEKGGINAISHIDNCLKNVREGSNPKLQLINLFFNFKQNVLRK